LDSFASNFGLDWAGLQSFISDVTGIPNPSIFDVLRSLRDDLGVLNIPDSMLIPGNGGAISITTPLLTVNNGSGVSSSTGWDGNAGAMVGNVGSLVVENGGEIRTRSGLFDPVSGEVFGVGVGNAGSLIVNAQGSITISGGSISSTTIGDGNGGSVELNAGNQVSIVNGGAVRADSGATIGGSAVSGTGLAGNITITAGNEIVFNKGQVTTQTLTADGGNITLLAPNIVQLQDSTISTSVQGSVGAGGNITIDPQFVIVNNSSIIANAFGGPGGNITIIANEFLQSATSVIEASSALSTPGVIEVRSPENNVENNIAQLPQAFIDASALLRGLCTARRTGAPSSFVVAGRGGVPVDADGYLPSFGTDVAAATAGTSGSTQADARDINRPVLAVALLLPNELDCLR
jgi:large exoprotein involved in heme utilization and adhesion